MEIKNIFKNILFIYFRGRKNKLEHTWEGGAEEEEENPEADVTLSTEPRVGRLDLMTLRSLPELKPRVDA